MNGRLVTQPAELVDTGADLCATPAHPWVSRAALKLINALDSWALSVEGRIVLDVGASTGGFTGVCLARGARRVFAVDVGRAQLHQRIAADSRVVNLDETDARTLARSLIPDPPELLVCDASFIGFAKVIPALGLAASQADLVALVKPQSEVGPKAIGKGGVVRDLTARERVGSRSNDLLRKLGVVSTGDDGKLCSRCQWESRIPPLGACVQMEVGLNI